MTHNSIDDLAAHCPLETVAAVNRPMPKFNSGGFTMHGKSHDRLPCCGRSSCNHSIRWRKQGAARLFSVAGALGLLLFGSVACGQARSDSEAAPAPWYVGVHGGYLSVDSELLDDDSGEFFRANIGRQLTPAWTVELEGSSGSAGDVDLSHIALNFLVVNRAVAWQPYFLAGFGSFDADIDPRGDTGAMAQLGIGGLWDLNGYGLNLRADLRYQHLDQSLDLIDDSAVTISIGIEFPFGR